MDANELSDGKAEIQRKMAAEADYSLAALVALQQKFADEAYRQYSLPMEYVTPKESARVS